jgi:hypothetical protein
MEEWKIKSKLEIAVEASTASTDAYHLELQTQQKQFACCYEHI